MRQGVIQMENLAICSRPYLVQHGVRRTFCELEEAVTEESLVGRE